MKSVEINYIYIGKKLDILGGMTMEDWKKELLKRVIVAVVDYVKEVLENK